MNMNHQKTWKRAAAFAALALAAVIPLASMAESAANTDTASASVKSESTAATEQMPGRGMKGGFPGGMMGGFSGGFQMDVSNFTQEQKTAYDSAVTLYEQVEDAVLADLVTANVVAKADVDAYLTLRTAQKSLAELDKSAWTAQQYKAFYEANAKTGDERKTAMQALADAGQLTQDQAAALSAQGETGLWAKIEQNASTNSAIQTAIETMRQAQQTLCKTLRDAGIEGMGKGMMPEGFQNGAMRFMQNSNNDKMPDHSQGFGGGRR